MVLLLDCWSVNLSADFQKWVAESYPFIRLRCIPAGVTGKVQINDTYFHGPFKKWVRKQAEDWYLSQLQKLMLRTELPSANPDFLDQTKLSDN